MARRVSVVTTAEASNEFPVALQVFIEFPLPQTLAATRSVVVLPLDDDPWKLTPPPSASARYSNGPANPMETASLSKTWSPAGLATLLRQPSTVPFAS